MFICKSGIISPFVYQSEADGSFIATLNAACLMIVEEKDLEMMQAQNFEIWNYFRYLRRKFSTQIDFVKTMVFRIQIDIVLSSILWMYMLILGCSNYKTSNSGQHVTGLHIFSETLVTIIS